VVPDEAQQERPGRPAAQIGGLRFPRPQLELDRRQASLHGPDLGAEAPLLGQQALEDPPLGGSLIDGGV
jgi:hypothetical protein